MKPLLLLFAALALVACEKKETPAKPAAAADEAPAAPTPEIPEEPPTQVEVTEAEQTAFVEAAKADITADNAEKAADDLLAEIEAELNAEPPELDEEPEPVPE